MLKNIHEDTVNVATSINMIDKLLSEQDSSIKTVLHNHIKKLNDNAVFASVAYAAQDSDMFEQYATEVLRTILDMQEQLA